ncbi:MAG: ATP phosphoribosyltransferase [Chloroflexota bacterium]|jgi:ATP phosphoribosyltransferase
MDRQDVRLSLPSKGRLGQETLDFLDACALKVYRPNPRQYAAEIPALPQVTVVFQRPGDIVASVEQGSVDFGITGADLLAEKGGDDQAILVLHEALGYASCSLALAVPDAWSSVNDVGDLARQARTMAEQGRPLRIATKYPRQTGRFLAERQVAPYTLIDTEGTLEIAPAIGYADMIADLVSSGTTLRDNHLRPLVDGTILESQACLIASQRSLETRPQALDAGLQLLEYIEAHLRAQNCYLVLANIRGASAEEVASKMFERPHLSGLQGPTISPVIPPDGAMRQSPWYAVNIIVRKEKLSPAIAELRAIGGSGVVVSPVTYIFEEEPERSKRLLAALQQ